MQRYEDYVADLRGNAKAGASVYVYAAGTTTASTIYSDDGVTAATNPLTTDSRGMFYFHAADGLYDLLVTGEGFTDYTVEDVQLFDSADGDLVGSSVTLTPSVAPGAPVEGQIYYDSAADALKVCVSAVGPVWETITSS